MNHTHVGFGIINIFILVDRDCALSKRKIRSTNKTMKCIYKNNTIN